ncbi:BNR repeat-containing protein [Georgenia faecalis]|uniref:BNR repeat-containing protein n=1 Tax=Georgenia faecalis TaxID=2483799 RepID=A0ABV9DBY7_9MICO|nr:BNR repeat-containing protein [Georgenia faecalis]
MTRWKRLPAVSALAVPLLLGASFLTPAAAQVAPAPGPLVCGTVDDGSVPATQEPEAVLDTVEVGPTWAGHYVGQALLTDGEDQYVGYYDADRQLTVAHRTLGSDSWTHQRVGSQTGWDSHNYVTLATDPSGNLHVAGNMHNVPLLYWRTTTPGDVTTLERVTTMVDAARERRVTYPVFLELEDETLVFRYRDGGSGNGIDLYNSYDAATGGWGGLIDSPLLSGEGQRNAYAAKPRLGPDGNYHMVWVWRNTPIASSTHTVSYARSADLESWETSTGEPLTLPITFATSDVVDPVPPEGGMINNNAQVGFDADGAPVVAYHKYDEEGNTQVYVARPDDSAAGWENVQVSDWTGAWDFSQPGTLVFQVEIYWAPEVLPDGNLRLDVTCRGEARTFILDGETLEPIEEIATPATEPAAVSELRSDYVHPVPGEGGTDMQVNLNDDSGAAGSFHARDLVPDADEDLRYLLRWESLGENQDRPRAAWPGAQPLEVVVLGTEDACRDGGWERFDFAGERACVNHVRVATGQEPVEEPAVTVDTGTRCVAGKAVQTVRVTSTEPVEAVVSGAYGTRTLTLAADRTVTVAFSTRLSSVPDGEVTVTTGTGDTATEVRADYTGHSCGIRRLAPAQDQPQE